MQISANGIDLIKRFEGKELEAYRDIAGMWTIGHGHTEGFRKGLLWPESVVTEAQAEALLRGDLESCEAALNGWRITKGVELNQNQFDALISFMFNVGIAAFKRSTAAKRLIKGDYAGAADALDMVEQSDGERLAARSAGPDAAPRGGA